jgi:hypothetical protein
MQEATRIADQLIRGGNSTAPVVMFGVAVVLVLGVFIAAITH